MKGNSRRNFLGKFGATVAVAAGAPAILAQQTQPTEKETRANMATIVTATTFTKVSTTFQARAPMTAIPETTIYS